MKKTCGIYKITSPSGKIYIGQSIWIERRISRYRTQVCKNQFALLASLKKYGFEKHLFEIIHECKIGELNDLEIFYIKHFDTFNTKHGLNLQIGGNCSRHITKGTRKRMSIAQKKRFLTYVHPNKGVKMSDEQKEKLRLHNTGNVHSSETKRKMSLSAKGKKRTKEHQEKLDSARRGVSPRKVKCKYCPIEISFLLVNRWHNENCKTKNK